MNKLRKLTFSSYLLLLLLLFAKHILRKCVTEQKRNLRKPTLLLIYVPYLRVRFEESPPPSVKGLLSITPHPPPFQPRPQEKQFPSFLFGSRKVRGNVNETRATTGRKFSFYTPLETAVIRASPRTSQTHPPVVDLVSDSRQSFDR